ncbi:kinase-like domain-containing protein, partial [Tribonema minus]
LAHPQPVGGSWLKNRYIVNNYILLNTLGTGSYAEVRLAKNKVDNGLYAVKIINKDVMSRRQMGKEGTFLDDVKREIAIMKKVMHPNVLRLYEVMDDPRVHKLYLVLEYMRKGDIMNVLSGDARRLVCDPMDDLGVWHIFRQVVQGLSYLHLQNIVHGDIKPQNLLLDDAHNCKIADFGISKMLAGSTQRLREGAGTPAFMSPELCAGIPYNGQLADVWALGATVYMIRFGRPPFASTQLLELYQKAKFDPLEFPPDVAASSGLKRLLQGMLVKDPSKRMRLEQVRAKWSPQMHYLGARGGAGAHKVVVASALFSVWGRSRCAQGGRQK